MKSGAQEVTPSSSACTTMISFASVSASAEKDTRTQPALRPPCTKMMLVLATLTKVVDVVEMPLSAVTAFDANGGQVVAASAVADMASATHKAAPAIKRVRA